MRLYKKKNAGVFMSWVCIMFSFLNRVADSDGRLDGSTNFCCLKNDLFNLEQYALA